VEPWLSVVRLLTEPLERWCQLAGERLETVVSGTDFKREERACALVIRELSDRREGRGNPSREMSLRDRLVWKALTEECGTRWP
jgi:hypothetical protein